MSDDHKDLYQFATLADLYKSDPEEIAKYNGSKNRDFWIVSHWAHREHFSLAYAREELHRLVEKHPEQKFRLYHCKRNMHRSRSRETIEALCTVIEDLLMPAGQGRPFNQRIARASRLVKHVKGLPQKAEKAA